MSPHAITHPTFVRTPLNTIDPTDTQPWSPTSSTLSQDESTSTDVASAGALSTSSSHDNLVQQQNEADQALHQATLVMSLAMSKKHNVELQKRLAALTADLDSTRADIEAVGKEKATAQAEMAEMKARIDQLESDLRLETARAGDLEVEVLDGVPAVEGGESSRDVWRDPAAFVMRHRPEWSHSEVCQWVRARLRSIHITADNCDYLGWALKTGTTASKWVATEEALERDLLPALTVKSLARVRAEAIVYFILFLIAVGWFLDRDAQHRKK